MWCNCKILEKLVSFKCLLLYLCKFLMFVQYLPFNSTGEVKILNREGVSKQISNPKLERQGDS